MNLFSNTVSIIFILNMIFAITLVFLERRDPTTTWAWILILNLLPGIGFILYLFLGLRFRKRKVYGEKQIKDFKLEQRFNQEFSCEGPECHLFEGMLNLGLRSSPTSNLGMNSLDIFVKGEDKFDDLFKSIQGAKYHVHVNYYIIKNDSLGQKLVDLLTLKALEGVEVRVLFDSVGCRKLPRNFFSKLEEAGGKASNFSRSFLDLNYRNHRKIVIIDGSIGYIGGFNVGIEYLGQNEEFGFWRDTHLKVHGDSVDSLQYRFLLDWSFATEEEIPYNEQFFPQKEQIGTVKMQIVSSGPDSKEEEIKSLFLKMIYSAKDSIYIQTPYFIPDQTMLEALRIATMSGVDVRIVIPDKPDHLFVYEANHSYMGVMLATGAKCYLYRGGFMHSKTIVVDGELASVGTTNMDVRSFKLNFEINAFIYDQETSTKLKDIFMEDLRKCEEVTMEAYNKRSNWLKFKESISRLISPIL
ncbi:cardiolipin synthase [Alkalicella caledoniensis]|uniref:Cardiolipin synthase n=1 Tax=Alkalicella caledoniensis TaxID=2731377 RepID=A0A7G9WA03_ALKCA|nr:cardiolipin synthase [Alkalicella caledoniensis]QNO15515.1 cardiolipin synthase [Alkalicella caledoniensis]